MVDEPFYLEDGNASTILVIVCMVYIEHKKAERVPKKENSKPEKCPAPV
jgi:hypothetical protein